MQVLSRAKDIDRRTAPNDNRYLHVTCFNIVARSDNMEELCIQHLLSLSRSQNGSLADINMARIV
jgi:hypothetical protein